LPPGRSIATIETRYNRALLLLLITRLDAKLSSAASEKVKLPTEIACAAALPATAGSKHPQQIS
jgi:hypothetical protein